MSSVGEVKSNSIGPSLWSCFVICFLCSAFAGLTSTLMSVYLPVVVRSLSGTVTDDQLNYISAYINSIYLVGWAIGGFVWGWISDRIGRVKAMAMAAVFMGLFTILIRYAPSWEYVVILRLLSGFSVGGILVLTPTLLSEVWPQKSRSIVIGIDSIGFPVGIFSSGLVNYVVADWRGAFMVGVIPISLGILSIWLLIESESWKQAKATLSTGAAKFTNLDRSNLVMGSIIFGSMLIGLWGMFSWIPTWVQSLLTEGGQSERGIAMMLLGAGGLTGGFISGWLSNALGVRRSMLFCFSGCILMSVLLFAMNSSVSIIVYIELGLLSMFFGISQGLLSIYIPQLFPFHIRGTATGFCFNIGRFATAAAVFFVGALVTTFGGYSNTLLAFAAIFIAGFTAVYLTKNSFANSTR